MCLFFVPIKSLTIYASLTFRATRVRTLLLTEVMEMEKEQFLKEFGKSYGYPDGPKSIDEIRATEFKRLANGIILYFCKMIFVTEISTVEFTEFCSI